MKSNITEIRHIGLTVQDLKKSLNFFVKDLGIKVHKKMDEEGTYLEKMLSLPKIKVTTVKLKAPDGNLIELLKFKNFKYKNKWQGKIYHTGPTHFALTVKNLDKTYAKLKKKYKFNSVPQYSPDGYAKVTFFNGPENLQIELVEIL